MIPILRLLILAVPKGSMPKTGTCTENYHINVSNDVNPTTNVEENNNDSDDREDNNISCL